MGASYLCESILYIMVVSLANDVEMYPILIEPHLIVKFHSHVDIISEWDEILGCKQEIVAVIASLTWCPVYDIVFLKPFFHIQSVVKAISRLHLIRGVWYSQIHFHFSHITSLYLLIVVDSRCRRDIRRRR